jgi:hypothetical protein
MRQRPQFTAGGPTRHFIARLVILTDGFFQGPDPGNPAMTVGKGGRPRVRRNLVATFQARLERLLNLPDRYEDDGRPNLCARAPTVQLQPRRIGTIDHPFRYLSVLSLRLGTALAPDELSIVLSQLFVSLLKLLHTFVERNTVARSESFFTRFVWRQPSRLYRQIHNGIRIICWAIAPRDNSTHIPTSSL